MMTMAIDQYGQTYHIGEHPPRKWLLECFDVSSCSKMYRDKKDGRTVHVGYIIAGLWLEIFEVKPWKQEGE